MEETSLYFMYCTQPTETFEAAEKNHFENPNTSDANLHLHS